MKWFKRNRGQKDGENKETSEKLIEVIEGELTDAEQRIEISKARARGIIARELYDGRN